MVPALMGPSLLPSARKHASLGGVAPLTRRTSRERATSMSKLLLILGLLALAVGLLWIGQGTGALPWPQSSFMIGQIQWAGYGAALAALGLILIWQCQR